MRPLYIFSLIAILSGEALTDQVLWSYSMSEIPPGWYINDGIWTFEPDGAHSSAAVYLFETVWNDLRSNPLILPPGTDSVGVSAGEVSATWESDLLETFSLARVYATVNGTGGIYWNVSGGDSDSLPISFVIPAVAGDTIAFQLVCAATCNPPPPIPQPEPGPQATATFQIRDFVVTAYGNITGLEPATWGSIKAHGVSYKFR